MRFDLDLAVGNRGVFSADLINPPRHLEGDGPGKPVVLFHVLLGPAVAPAVGADFAADLQLLLHQHIIFDRLIADKQLEDIGHIVLIRIQI